MKTNILIVDDSKAICTAMSMALTEKLDINAIIAYTKKEATEKLQKYKDKISVAIVDLSLPDAQNGEEVELVTKLNIPTIVLTGNAKSESEFRDKNIVDYVVKDNGFAFEYIASLVKKIVLCKGMKVLVVDDSKTARHRIVSLLKRYNLNCLEASDGIEALQVLDQNKDIRLILADQIMPNMDGLELVKTIRKYYPKDELSILAISEVTNRKVITNFLKFGANDFINKGFTDEEFYARLSSLLEVIELFEYIQQKADRDFLTNAYNRRYFFNEGLKKFQNSNNVKVFMLDIDKFKNINDTYGHNIGDKVIKETVNIINKTLQNTNSLLARFGGEEFCGMIFDESKNRFIKTIEEIRNNIEKSILHTSKGEISFTVSIGYYTKKANTLDDMVNYSDLGLYKAKNSGRNQSISI